MVLLGVRLGGSNHTSRYALGEAALEELDRAGEKADDDSENVSPVGVTTTEDDDEEVGFCLEGDGDAVLLLDEEDDGGDIASEETAIRGKE